MDKLRACLFCGGKRDEDGVMSGLVRKPESKFEGKHIMKIFEEKIRRKKIMGRTAIHFSDGGLLTFCQLNAMASCLAKTVTERLGYDYKIQNPDGDMLIAVCLPMSEKAIALILGILKMGAAYLPLDPIFPESLLFEIIEAFKPVMLVSDDNGKIFNKYDTDRFNMLCHLVSIEELWLDVEFAKEPNTRRASIENAWDIDFLEESKESNPALRPIVVFYSHGLLDNPVGVRLCTKSILNTLEFSWQSLTMSKKDINVVTVNIASPFSIPQLFTPLLFGCTVHVFRRIDVADVDKFVKNISWRNVTNLSVPTHYLDGILESVANMGNSKSLSLKFIICRGALVPYNTVKTFFSVFKNGVELAIRVGSVETTCDVGIDVYCSLKDYESRVHGEFPGVRNIIDNTIVYVVDNNLNLVATGTTGEICIAGDCLALGYVDEKNCKEQKNFIENPFNTLPQFSRLFKTGGYGKIVRCGDGKKHLIYEGRKDSYVRVRGNKICTREVNEYLGELDGVDLSFCCMHHEEGKHPYLIGFVVLEKGVARDETLEGEYDYALRNRLPEFAVPEEIHFLDGIPECKCGGEMTPCQGCWLDAAKNKLLNDHVMKAKRRLVGSMLVCKEF